MLFVNDSLQIIMVLKTVHEFGASNFLKAEAKCKAF